MRLNLLQERHGRRTAVRTNARRTGKLTARARDRTPHDGLQPTDEDPLLTADPVPQAGGAGRQIGRLFLQGEEGRHQIVSPAHRRDGVVPPTGPAHQLDGAAHRTGRAAPLIADAALRIGPGPREEDTGLLRGSWPVPRGDGGGPPRPGRGMAPVDEAGLRIWHGVLRTREAGLRTPEQATRTRYTTHRDREENSRETKGYHPLRGADSPCPKERTMINTDRRTNRGGNLSRHTATTLTGRRTNGTQTQRRKFGKRTIRARKWWLYDTKRSCVLGYKDDGRLIRSPPTSRPASSERRITPVEEVEPTVSSPTGLISAMKPTDGRRRPTPNKDNRPPSSKDPVQPVLHQAAKDPGPLPSTSAAFLGNPPEYGKDQTPSVSAAKPPEIRTTSPSVKVTTAAPPPKKTEVYAPASVKTVDETKKDGSFHDLQMDLAPPKQEPSTSKAKQPQSAASQKLTTETPANSNQKNVANPTPEVTQAQQKDANAKAAPTGSAKAKSPKPKLQSPLQENGSVSKKKPSFSEKKYQTSDEPVKTAVIAKEVKPLERKLERKDTAQVLKDKDLNMDTEFLDLDDRKGSGKTLVKDRPAKKKGDWMASKKTQGTSKRHGKKKPTSRKDAHIQELSGSEKACYTCAGYCMCCACCYRLFKDDDDDEVFRRRKCITVFLAIALAIVLVGLIIGLCIGLGGLGGPAPTSPPRFILVPQNLNPVVVGNQPVSAGTPAGTGTGTAAGTANDSSTATDGATPGGTTG
ncbi:Hypp8646 [Branchiostoma lanceolatum]|uniref:Hypp8646 protein n=1 Tax=Branchiostoma lanceolatum TaxID=7740 RepID=A0A8J9Z9I0_BRALA|nr:Hypp8646 [Branchiostoma lanceolatum]